MEKEIDDLCHAIHTSSKASKRHKHPKHPNSPTTITSHLHKLITSKLIRKTTSSRRISTPQLNIHPPYPRNTSLPELPDPPRDNQHRQYKEKGGDEQREDDAEDDELEVRVGVGPHSVLWG